MVEKRPGYSSELDLRRTRNCVLLDHVHYSPRYKVVSSQLLNQFKLITFAAVFDDLEQIISGTKPKWTIDGYPAISLIAKYFPTPPDCGAS
jgi:hypothetical protein